MGMLAAPVIAMVDPALLPAMLILLALLVTVLVTVRERQQPGSAGHRLGAGGPDPRELPRCVAGGGALPRRAGLGGGGRGADRAGAGGPGLGAPAGPGNLIAAGAASGIMGTATSIGGPPMALIWQGHQPPEARHYERVLPGGLADLGGPAGDCRAGDPRHGNPALWLSPGSRRVLRLPVVNRFLDADRLQARGPARGGRRRPGAGRAAAAGLACTLNSPPPADGPDAAAAPAGQTVAPGRTVAQLARRRPPRCWRRCQHPPLKRARPGRSSAASG